MDRATRKRLYNLCDPSEPLAPRDPRYVDVDSFGVRGKSWVDEIASRIELSHRPVCELLAAPVGAGVTTEMLRLARRLQDGANLLAVHIDAEAVMDVRSPIHEVDLLVALLERVEDAVAGPEAASRRRDSMRRPLEVLISREAPSERFEATSVSPVDVLRGNPAARGRVRSWADANLSKVIADVRDELILLEDDARRSGREGIVVLFDGLEKLTGTLADRLLVLDSAERVFTRGAPWLSLPVHVIFTLPIALLPRLHIPVRVLPMIALHDRAGRRRSEGLEAAHRVVTQRVPSSLLDEMFGATDREELTDRVVEASGGSLRQIVRLLQSVVAEPSIDEALFGRLLSMQSDEFRRAISSREAPWLASVAEHHSLDYADAAEREVAERMLLRGAVLPYQNGELWFDLHPAVYRAPAVKALT